MKLGLIGCGFMGEALLKAAIAQSVVKPEEVFVAEVNSDRAADISKTHGVRVSPNPATAADGANLILLAVKPQEFASVARALQGNLGGDATVVSIMAGQRIEAIERALGHAAIVRVMPNSPAAIGEGMSVWTATRNVGGEARGHVEELLNASGRSAYVDDEKYLDMATALSGSGPGFVYLLLEAFIDAGVNIGFRRDVAEMLAIQTFMGSTKYAAASGKHPAVLRNEVTSPGGTTAAGLQVLESAGIRSAIAEAVESAYERARELGEK